LNPLRKLAGQTAIYGLPTIVGRLLNYLLVPLYTRAFVPAEYGVVTEMYAYVAFLFIVLTYGMETTYFRFASGQQGKGSVFGTALCSLGFTSAIFALAGFTFAGPISGWMGYQNHPEYIRWFVLIIATDAITTIPYASLRLQNKPFRFAFIKIANIATNIGLNLFFIVFCPYVLAHYSEGTFYQLIHTFYNPSIGVGYIFISNLAASLVTFGMLLPDMVKQLKRPDAAMLRQMLVYAWPLLIFGLAGTINETFDRIILKYLLPKDMDVMAQLGIYGANYKVSILMTLFVQTYRYAAEPFFFAHAKETNAKETYARLMHYFIIICLLIFLAVTLFLKDVLLFIGPAYRVGAPVIPILLLANLFLGVFYNLSVWFKLTDQTRKGALISLAGAGLTLGLNLLLIPFMGYMGAAWATIACYAFMMVISYLWGQRYYPVNYSLKAAFGYFALALGLYAVSHWLAPASGLFYYLTNGGLLMIFVLLVLFREIKPMLSDMGRK
jgi:O-antigen/teichoic acid export membrane protein